MFCAFFAVAIGAVILGGISPQGRLTLLRPSPITTDTPQKSSQTASPEPSEWSHIPAQFRDLSPSTSSLHSIPEELIDGMEMVEREECIVRREKEDLERKAKPLEKLSQHLLEGLDKLEPRHESSGHKVLSAKASASNSDNSKDSRFKRLFKKFGPGKRQEKSRFGGGFQGWLSKKIAKKLGLVAVSEGLGPVFLKDDREADVLIEHASVFETPKPKETRSFWSGIEKLVDSLSKDLIFQDAGDLTFRKLSGILGNESSGVKPREEEKKESKKKSFREAFMGSSKFYKTFDVDKALEDLDQMEKEGREQGMHQLIKSLYLSLEYKMSPKEVLQKSIDGAAREEVSQGFRCLGTIDPSRMSVSQLRELGIEKCIQMGVKTYLKAFLIHAKTIEVERILCRYLNTHSRTHVKPIIEILCHLASRNRHISFGYAHRFKKNRLFGNSKELRSIADGKFPGLNLPVGHSEGGIKSHGHVRDQIMQVIKIAIRDADLSLFDEVLHGFNYKMLHRIVRFLRTSVCYSYPILAYKLFFLLARIRSPMTEVMGASILGVIGDLPFEEEAEIMKERREEQLAVEKPTFLLKDTDSDPTKKAKGIERTEDAFIWAGSRKIACMIKRRVTCPDLYYWVDRKGGIGREFRTDGEMTTGKECRLQRDLSQTDFIMPAGKGIAVGILMIGVPIRKAKLKRLIKKPGSESTGRVEFLKDYKARCGRRMLTEIESPSTSTFFSDDEGTALDEDEKAKEMAALFSEPRDLPSPSSKDQSPKLLSFSKELSPLTVSTLSERSSSFSSEQSSTLTEQSSILSEKSFSFLSEQPSTLSDQTSTLSEQPSTSSESSSILSESSSILSEQSSTLTEHSSTLSEQISSKSSSIVHSPLTSPLPSEHLTLTSTPSEQSPVSTTQSERSVPPNSKDEQKRKEYLEKRDREALRLIRDKIDSVYDQLSFLLTLPPGYMTHKARDKLRAFEF